MVQNACLLADPRITLKVKDLNVWDTHDEINTAFLEILQKYTDLWMWKLWLLKKPAEISKYSGN